MPRIRTIFTRLLGADHKNPEAMVRKVNDALDEISSALQEVSGSFDASESDIASINSSITNIENTITGRFFTGDDEPNIIGVVLRDKNENEVYIWPEIGDDGVAALIWDTTKP